MMKTIRKFWASEEGLVTVEWVALASALVVGAIAIGWMVLDSLHAPAQAIGGDITAHAGTDPGAG